MKKFWIIAGCILLVAGIILCAVGYSMGGADFWNWNNYTVRSEEYDPSEVEHILINETSGDIVFKPSSDGLIHLEYRETEHDTPYSSSLENGRLTLQRPAEKKNWIYTVFGFSFVDTRVIVSIPDGLSCSIECKCKSGDIDMADLPLIRDLSISVTSGDIQIKNCSSEAAAVSVTSGDIDVSGLETGDLSFSFKSGDITCSDIVCSGSATLKGSSGDIELSSFAADGEFFCSTSSGDIEISSLASPDITAKASSGDIKITVLGDEKDYRVSASASSGDVDSPRSSKGDKSVDVKTSSGDIKIEFIG